MNFSIYPRNEQYPWPPAVRLIAIPSEAAPAAIQALLDAGIWFAASNWPEGRRGLVVEDHNAPRVSELLRELKATAQPAPPPDETGLEQQQAVARRSEETAFWAAVNSALPRWRETNADNNFLRWLGERDDDAACSRQEALNQARAALDAKRVVAIFNTWSQAQTVSRGWIAEQNRLYAQGYYRRRQQEWQGIQQTIDRAAREGRIR